MGEAAVKEPSMEDILSSIRKIISEEGSASIVEQAAPAPAVDIPAPQATAATDSKMTDVLDQVRAAMPETESLSQIARTNNASDDVSGNQAAKMAASLASIAETVKAEVHEPVSEAPVERAYVETTAPEQVAEAPVEHAYEETPKPEQNAWDDVAQEPVLEEPVFKEPAMEIPAPLETQPTPSLASIAENITEQIEVPVAAVSQVAQEPEIRVEMAEATHALTSEVEAPVSVAAVETMVEQEMAFKGALMSPSADGAVAGAFDRLKRSAMDDIDAKTESILRPMLREWLDENLPKMVERLVREEIERVARGV